MQLLNIILLSILLPALSISGISIQDSGRNYVSESVVSVLGVASASQVAAQPYRFNAKEDQSFTGVPLLDYGARFYNPTLARWTSPDPLAEKYYSVSPYAFCNNNPVSYVDPDGMDFRKTVRGSSIVIKTTYYTNVNSLKSANQAAKFWNQRQDKYISKSGKQFTVNYELKIQKTDNLSAFKEGVNTYEVVDAFESEGRAGATRDGRNVEVLDEYSINRPGSDAESTTGAHEIGHTLGMEHSEQGIMSRQQDESRTHEVTQDNIRQMLESERGNADILTIIINAIFKVYEQQ